MKKVVELKRERIEKNIEMKFLSNSQVRAINLNTGGGYEIHDVSYSDQVQRLYRLPPQEKWIWKSVHDNDPNIVSNPIYDKASKVIRTISKRSNSLPLRTEKEEKELKRLLDSTPDFSTKLHLVGLSALMRPKDDPIAKARDAARKAFTVVREYVLGLVEKYENRTMIESEYNELMNFSADELVEKAFEDKYNFLTDIDLEGITVREGSTLELMVTEFERIVQTTSFYYLDFEEHMQRVMGTKRPSAEDIENFSVLMAQYQDAGMFDLLSGNFLGYFVDKCTDDKIEIKTKHLEKAPSDFTFKRKKNVEVVGDMGDNLFDGFKSGKVIVYGSVGKGISFHHKSGNVVVTGNCGDRPGYMMHGGTITINGDTGKNVGNSMSGGDIYLNGSYRSIEINDDPWVVRELKIRRGGRVFHKGELIVEAGKRVSILG